MPPSLVNPPPVTRTSHGLVSIIMFMPLRNIVKVYVYVHGGDYRTCTQFVSYITNESLYIKVVVNTALTLSSFA